MTTYQNEIYEQPAALDRIVNSNWESFNKLAEQIRKKSIKKVLIAARGTSDNAAIYAKYLLSAFAGIPVGLAIPSLYTIYHQPPDMSDGVIIGISQSGCSTDVLAVLEDARQKGIISISITNDDKSPMAQIADYSICVKAGVENAIAASKSYTSTLAAIAILTAVWTDNRKQIEEIKNLPAWAEESLKQHQKVKSIAHWFAASNQMVVLGRGFNHCTSQEIALKTKELSYMVAEAYSAADFRHGPIAMLMEGFPVVAVAPADKTLDDMKAIVQEVKALGVKLAVISNEKDVLEQSNYAIELPKNLPGWLSPIIATVPGQLLALELAIEKGLDVDKPRGLKKITFTL
jgi:glucosamine--fructose-6-phosphate aminotransferase (isomerizing)